MSIFTSAHGRTLVVTIDRPSFRNAVDGPTATALHGAFVDFDDDDDLDVAVLTGAGDTFCSGADLKAFGTPDGNRVERDMTRPGPMGCTRLSLRKPVIAAIEGHAVAGGLELAVWCDLRVASREATFGVFCRRWGVPLIDGGTVRLPRLIGHGRALDMILTGRPVSGVEAESWGLANRLAEPGEALGDAIELAAHLAKAPQLCMRTDRQSSYEQWGLPLDEALANEVRLGFEPIESGEAIAGAERFGSGAGRHGTALP